jgi:hypothetical protein
MPSSYMQHQVILYALVISATDAQLECSTESFYMHESRRTVTLISEEQPVQAASGPAFDQSTGVADDPEAVS